MSRGSHHHLTSFRGHSSPKCFTWISLASVLFLRSSGTLWMVAFLNVLVPRTRRRDFLRFSIPKAPKGFRRICGPLVDSAWLTRCEIRWVAAEVSPVVKHEGLSRRRAECRRRDRGVRIIVGQQVCGGDKLSRPKAGVHVHLRARTVFFQVSF